ncbi:MAG: methyltransferase [Candidatus Aenigmarchaeota archaeon]|nr:methyltransferase [Candidatus Aenigmarchaeota archaeon]
MKYYFKIGQSEIQLDIPGSVYYPEEDSELFADFITKHRTEFLKKKVLEIGCGSGLLSLLCAKFGASVLATDINPSAIHAVLENAKTNNIPLEAVQSDLFSKIKGKFDFIIFNTPYLPDEDQLTKKAYSPNYNKGDVIKRFLAEYKGYLNKSGKAYALVSSITTEEIKGKIIEKRKIDWEELRIIELK